jgi:ribosome-associated protein
MHSGRNSPQNIIFNRNGGAMSDVTNPISLNENEIGFTFIRSSGSGGQNVNKVATTAQLRFNVLNSVSLSEDQKLLIVEKIGSRVIESGDIIITARRFRTQERNRADAIERLTALIEKSIVVQKERKKSKPSQAVKEKRLKSKKNQKMKKESRRAVNVHGYG